MKYVKLIAKPNTWFKEGTEVYDYDCNPPDDLRRMTLECWESWGNFVCLCCGRRIADKDYPAEMARHKEGEEYWDGENCSCSEFEVEVVDEPR